MTVRKPVRRARTAIVLAASAALILGTALPAAADAYSITAQLNCAGSLFQGGKYRFHPTGPASIRLTKHDWWKSEWKLRIGLRVGDTQTTRSLEFAPSSRTTHGFRTTSGSSTLPRNYYAVNARVATYGNGGCVLFPPSFEATLNL